MTHVRKSRAPKIDLEALKLFQAALEKPELLQFSQRFEKFENMRRAGELPTTFIAFEAISALLGGLVAGHSEEELKNCWPADWGSATIELPITLINTLVTAWSDYSQNFDQSSMGKVFKLEGDGSNTRRILRKIADLNKGLSLANAVEVEYLAGQFDEERVTLEMAIEKVSDAHGAAFDTVRKAHRRYRSEVRDNLALMGILIG